MERAIWECLEGRELRDSASANGIPYETLRKRFLRRPKANEAYEAQHRRYRPHPQRLYLVEEEKICEISYWKIGNRSPWTSSGSHPSFNAIQMSKRRSGSVRRAHTGKTPWSASPSMSTPISSRTWIERMREIRLRQLKIS